VAIRNQSIFPDNNPTCTSYPVNYINNPRIVALISIAHPDFRKDLISHSPALFVALKGIHLLSGECLSFILIIFTGKYLRYFDDINFYSTPGLAEKTIFVTTKPLPNTCIPDLKLFLIINIDNPI